jgi:Rha family phage regulatory protein
MLDLSEFVTINNDTLVTDSRRVAKHFKKRHDNVLQAIDRLDCSKEYHLLNFQEVIEEYENGYGAKQKARTFCMTKDGWMFLVMGFKGQEASRIKEAYIKAFNAMGDQLHRIQTSLWRQMLDLERRDASSQSWASFGSHCMLERKKDKPLIENERSILSQQIQPDLLPTAVLPLH